MDYVILHVPHASLNIPDDIKSTILLDDGDLETELLNITDRYTDEIFTAPGITAIKISLKSVYASERNGS